MFTKEELINIIATAEKKSDVYIAFGYTRNPNSRTTKKIKSMVLETIGTSLDEEFSKRYTITKTCPVCGDDFSFPRSEPRRTCSYACSNTYFKEVRHPNPSSYRTICFRHHQHKCIVCGESNIVEVHHYDEDHKNDDPKNLVPLCPTHHTYFHSRYRHLVEDIIQEYMGVG